MDNKAFFLNLLDAHVEDSRIRFLMGSEDRTVGQGSGGDGNSTAVTIRIHDNAFFDRVLGSGNLGMGESYMLGEFEIETGTLQDFIMILLRNRLDHKIRARPREALRILKIRVTNWWQGKTKCVRRHYDIGDELFETFLDPTLTYSCGYARHPSDDLEQLQQNKLDRICRKLDLKTGQHLLDIGCGYGGLLIHAARHFDVRGTGITISKRHFERGRSLVAEQGLGDRVEIELLDFTKLSGQYDRVVSVGMLEHVPRTQYGAFFRGIARIMTREGKGLVHAIGANAPRNVHDPFIQKYIFPHANQLKLSEITRQLEKNGLAILDVENMIRHYGYTTRRWLEGFKQNRHRLDPAKYDRTFVRMWEYFLCCGIAASFASDGALYQVLFCKDYAAEMPLHRV
jgi:cyclopropane-fatty-acyl-phospholipid synthase